MLTFKTYWDEYSVKTVEERREYFDALDKPDRQQLLKSFFDDGWHDLFMQNLIDKSLDQIKQQFSIDLLDMRIKAIKFGKVFLIDKDIWETIESKICQYADYCNIDIYFGGLLIEDWGRKNQFYRIRAKQNKWR